MKAVHRGKITGEKIIVNVQVLIRESCFDLLIGRRRSPGVGDGGAVIADRIYRHQMEIGAGIRSEELFIIGNVSVSFCDIVDAQIQDHRGIWRLGKGGGQFAGTFIFQPFVAFAFLCDEAAGVGGLMAFTAVAIPAVRESPTKMKLWPAAPSVSVI